MFSLWSTFSLQLLFLELKSWLLRQLYSILNSRPSPPFFISKEREGKFRFLVCDMKTIKEEQKSFGKRFCFLRPPSYSTHYQSFEWTKTAYTAWHRKWSNSSFSFFLCVFCQTLFRFFSFRTNEKSLLTLWEKKRESYVSESKTSSSNKTNGYLTLKNHLLILEIKMFYFRSAVGNTRIKFMFGFYSLNKWMKIIWETKKELMWRIN